MAAKKTKPTTQVKVDEAVATTPDFKTQLAAAMSPRAAEADEHFDRRITGPTRMVLPIGDLRAMKTNPRATLGDVTALVKSIESNGFLGALSVRELPAENGGSWLYEVWAGNRRLEAARLAGLEVVPCDVYELTEVQALELNLTEQINRSDLSPLEEGEACRRLIELSGYTTQQVADKLGQSSSWVVKRVSLCGLAPEAKKALSTGEVSLTVAQALAALPAQKSQVQALEVLATPYIAARTTKEQLEALRESCARPLAGATWKLTDAELLPEAGACSECPHNSANAKMVGLFDDPRAKPACALPSCFDDKLRAAWTAKTAKAAAQGAKVLSLAEGKKLFPRPDSTLPYASKYVPADAVVQEDRQKRTWRQLLGDCDVTVDEGLPVLHLACGADGKARELYLEAKALECIAKHLKLKWALKKEEAEVERAERESPASDAARKLEREVRAQVQLELVTLAAKKLSTNFTLSAARVIAERCEWRLKEYFEAQGKKEPKDWLSDGATMAEVLAFVWWCETQSTSSYAGFDETIVALAEKHGFDLEAAVKAAMSAGKAA